MTRWQLIVDSARHYRWHHLGVLAGIAIATAVIAGALFVGDSVRHTLRHTALTRLGNTHFALQTHDRPFTVGFADALREAHNGTLSAALTRPAVITARGGASRAANVNLIGIDPHFAKLLGGPDPPAPGTMHINAALARQLNLLDDAEALADAEAVIRTSKLSVLPSDAPIIDAEKDARAQRVSIARIIPDEQGGRFSLLSQQIEPFNAFVDRAWLQQLLEAESRANLLLAGAESTGTRGAAVDVTAAELADEVSARWAISDAQFELAPLERDDSSSDSPTLELRTPRVFIDAAVVASLGADASEQILTYLTNDIRRADATEPHTPYSMVTATTALPDLAPDQIAINRWLADDLSCNVGDQLTLTYFLPNEGHQLAEGSATFTVARILEMDHPLLTRDRVPDFPGLSNAEQLADWDGGPAIDRERIRDKDEDYWDEFGPTPKAFIALEAAESLWKNRFGNRTALRFDSATMSPDRLRSLINPQSVGLTFRDVRTPALAASSATVDFGALFLSLSFFIVVAALLLSGLLFTFSVEVRRPQVGLLLAIGWSPARVRTTLLIEVVLVAIVGATLGVGLAWLYAASVLGGLNSGWGGAVAGLDIQLSATLTSALTGLTAALAAAIAAMLFTLRGLTRESPRALLQRANTESNTAPTRTNRITAALGLLLISGAILLGFFSRNATGMDATGRFFATGAMLLTGGLALLYAWIRRPAPTQASQLGLAGLARRNATRRPSRSLAVVSLLGFGVFLVIAVAGFHQAAPRDPSDRASGTGGFALLGQTTLPLAYDLNTATARDQFGIYDEELPPGSVVPIRVVGRDDASCLNLNRVANPILFGVDPSQLSERNAFTFTADASWNLIQDPNPNDDVIPAIADANTAQWSLHLAIGDTLDYQDQQGNTFQVQLVGTVQNSILQGSLIVDAEALLARYPTSAGVQRFLIDAPSDEIEARRDLLTDLLSDVGFSAVHTAERMDQLNRVQNTYLSIFQLLGGLGVLLGTIGMGVVIARNILERQSEIAVMQAVGYTARRVQRLLLIEFTSLLALGILLGAGAAIAAVIPTLRTAANDQTPISGISIAIVLLMINGLIWLWLGTRTIQRVDPLTVLKRDS